MVRGVGATPATTPAVITASGYRIRDSIHLRQSGCCCQTLTASTLYAALRAALLPLYEATLTETSLRMRQPIL